MKKILILSLIAGLALTSAGVVFGRGEQAQEQNQEQSKEQTKEQKAAMEQLTFHWRTHEQARAKEQVQDQARQGSGGTTIESIKGAMRALKNAK